MGVPHTQLASDCEVEIKDVLPATATLTLHRFSYGWLCFGCAADMDCMVYDVLYMFSLNTTMLPS